jgi:integrase/recombinase XerD
MHPQGVELYIQRHLEWLREKNYSYSTVESRREILGYFLVWCQERSLVRIAEVSKTILERYWRYVFLYRKADGKPLAARTQRVRLTAIRMFFRWLSKQNHILSNPCAELELPLPERRLPKHILSVAEAEAILAAANISKPYGIRDRAILETFYSTGMRRSELVNLKLLDVDVERGTVMIRQGKGKKDRMIPIGARALEWVVKYRDDIRPLYAKMDDDGSLFLRSSGKPYTPKHLGDQVKKLVDQAGLSKRGGCHLFRHTMATLMLEHGADIRYIQAMLGHASLETTQIYTQISIQRLKEVHTQTHPAKPIQARGWIEEELTPIQSRAVH